MTNEVTTKRNNISKQHVQIIDRTQNSTRTISLVAPGSSLNSRNTAHWKAGLWSKPLANFCAQIGKVFQSQRKQFQSAQEPSVYAWFFPYQNIPMVTNIWGNAFSKHLKMVRSRFYCFAARSADEMAEIYSMTLLTMRSAHLASLPTISHFDWLYSSFLPQIAHKHLEQFSNGLKCVKLCISISGLGINPCQNSALYIVLILGVLVLNFINIYFTCGDGREKVFFPCTSSLFIHLFIYAQSKLYNVTWTQTFSLSSVHLRYIWPQTNLLNTAAFPMDL